MVNQLGQWTEEKDYSTYPKGQWCDYDTMANYIRNIGYEPVTSMENLISMIFAHYECEIEDNEDGYFEIKDTRKGDYSLHLEDYICYINATGGLKEFDYCV